MTPRALAVSTWGQLADLGILPPLMRVTDEASTSAVAAAPADEPGRAGYLVRLRGGEGARVTVPEPDPNEPASQIDDDSPRRVAIDQNGNDGTHYVCRCGNDGYCACGSGHGPGKQSEPKPLWFDENTCDKGIKRIEEYRNKHSHDAGDIGLCSA